MNPQTITPDRLERLRAICLALPEASEKEAWGDPTWRVAGKKMFAAQKGNVVGHRPSVWMKAPDGAQQMLVDAAPDRIFVPPYVGHKGWIGLWLDGQQIDWAEVEMLIESSFRLVAPKKVAALLPSVDDAETDDHPPDLPVPQAKPIASTKSGGKLRKRATGKKEK